MMLVLMQMLLFLLEKEADAAIQEGKEGEVCFSIQSYIFTE